MSADFDFKKEWEKTRKQLIDFSQQAAKVAKKGEEELVKFSQKSMVHIDVTAANLKKEKLYYQIGKHYAEQVLAGNSEPDISKLMDELKKVVQEEKGLQKKLKTQANTARKAKKTTAAKKKSTAPAKKTAAKKTAAKKTSPSENDNSASAEN